MGNICIIMIDPQPRSKPSYFSDSEGASTSSSQTSHSSHGSSSFTKRWVNLSGKRFVSLKRPRRHSPDSPVWQRGILMGERCEPPDFSGLILYDEHGNHVQQFPKSPKHPAVPLAV